MKHLKTISLLLAVLIVVLTLGCSSIKKQENPNLAKKWWKQAVCYEIYVWSFKDSNGDGMGDLNGITEELDYLHDLGVDVIWITPFYPSPGVDMGYDISNYKAVDPKFGTMEDFQNLIKKAHKLDIKVLVDMVFSHTSNEHPWFKNALKSKDNQYYDFYNWEKPKEGNKPPNDWQSWFSGPAWEYVENYKEYYLHVFAKQQPALNWENPKVRKEMAGVAKFWLDKGVDGLRFDVITLISMPKLDQSADLWGTMPKVHTYLKALNKDVLSKYDILTVGEMPGVNYKNAEDYISVDQHQLETVFQLDIMSLGCANHNKFEPVPYDLLKFKEIYENWYNGLYGKGWNSIVLGNHDQQRVVNRWGDAKNYWKESAKMLATFELTQWGTPYIYEGDEIGMKNCPFTRKDFRDVEAINYYNAQIKAGKKVIDFLPGLLARSRDNARTPMQWSDAKNAGFTTGDKTWIKVNPNYKEINVKSEEKDPASILNYYKKMIKVRKANPGLTYGTYAQIDPENKEVFAYTRNYEGKSFLVVLNFKGNNVKLDTSIKELNTKSILINNYDEAPKITNDGVIDLKPYEAAIYVIK